MGAAKVYIVLKLQTKNPIEVGDFVSEFTSLSSQYERFIKDNYPDLGTEARFFVKQVKRGSIVIEMLPFVPFIILGAQEVVSHVEHINAVNDFVKHYGDKLKSFFKKDGRVEDASRSDLKDFMGSVAAIATDPDGKAAIEAVVYEDNKKKIRAAIRFELETGVPRRQKH